MKRAPFTNLQALMIGLVQELHLIAKTGDLPSLDPITKESVAAWARNWAAVVSAKTRAEYLGHRELIWYAAKQAKMGWGDEVKQRLLDESIAWHGWNPIEEPCEAFALACDMKFTVSLTECECCAKVYGKQFEDEGPIAVVRYSREFDDCAADSAETAYALAVTMAAAAVQIQEEMLAEVQFEGVSGK